PPGRTRHPPSDALAENGGPRARPDASGRAQDAPTARSDAGFLQGLEHLVRLEQIERVVHDLLVADDPLPIDDEVRPLPIPVGGTLLIRDEGVVGREHLPAEVGEQEVGDAVVPGERVERIRDVGAHAHDLGVQGVEVAAARLEALDLGRSDPAERLDERVEDDGSLGGEVRQRDLLAARGGQGEVGRLLPDLEGACRTDYSQPHVGGSQRAPSEAVSPEAHPLASFRSTTHTLPRTRTAARNPAPRDRDRRRVPTGPRLLARRLKVGNGSWLTPSTRMSSIHWRASWPSSPIGSALTNSGRSISSSSGASKARGKSKVTSAFRYPTSSKRPWRI